MTPVQAPAAHTPGPWRTWSRRQPESGDFVSVASVGTGSDAIAIVSSHPDAQFIGEPEDDARLIAAAPDLLEALQAIADSWPAHGSGAQNAMADAMAAKARAALSRATGSEQ